MTIAELRRKLDNDISKLEQEAISIEKQISALDKEQELLFDNYREEAYSRYYHDTENVKEVVSSGVDNIINLDVSIYPVVVKNAIIDLQMKIRKTNTELKSNIIHLQSNKIVLDKTNKALVDLNAEYVVSERKQINDTSLKVSNDLSDDISNMTQGNFYHVLRIYNTDKQSFDVLQSFINLVKRHGIDQNYSINQSIRFTFSRVFYDSFEQNIINDYFKTFSKDVLVDLPNSLFVDDIESVIEVYNDRLLKLSVAQKDLTESMKQTDSILSKSSTLKSTIQTLISTIKSVEYSISELNDKLSADSLLKQFNSYIENVIIAEFSSTHNCKNITSAMSKVKYELSKITSAIDKLKNSRDKTEREESRYGRRSVNSSSSNSYRDYNSFGDTSAYIGFVDGYNFSSLDSCVSSACSSSSSSCGSSSSSSCGSSSSSSCGSSCGSSGCGS